MQFLAVRDSGLPQVQGVQITTPTLHRQMPQLAMPYDLAIIDVGGRDAPVFRSALTAADTVLIPLVASAFDSWASQDVLTIVDELAVVREFTALAVLNQLTHTVVAREAFSALSEDLASRSVRLLESRIHHRTAWPRSIGEGLSVVEWEPSGTAAEELRGLCSELGLDPP
jgi:chromosome partitioning protein